MPTGSCANLLSLDAHLHSRTQGTSSPSLTLPVSLSPQHSTQHLYTMQTPAERAVSLCSPTHQRNETRNHTHHMHAHTQTHTHKTYACSHARVVSMRGTTLHTIITPPKLPFLHSFLSITLKGNMKPQQLYSDKASKANQLVPAGGERCKLNPKPSLVASQRITSRSR